MKRSLSDLIRRVETFAWFAQCGNPLASNEVTQVANWAEAKRLCVARIAQNVQLELQNRITNAVAASSMARWNQSAQLWPKICAALACAWGASVKALRAHFKSAAAENYVKSDIFNACIEIEYADVIPPRHFQERVGWYERGHFPCGWNGDFPEGRLFVF